MNNFKNAIEKSIQFVSSKFRMDVSDRIDIDYITQVVCSEKEINPEVVFKRTRKREIVQSRQLIQHFAKELTNYSLGKIGANTGGYDHATIIHSHKTVNDLACTNKEYKEIYQNIEKKLL